jgi:low affinity Fe/Cu permease
MHSFERRFAALASGASRVAGSPLTFLACVAIVLLWALSGPIFHFSQTWQLVINTGTTIVTFLMVFLIQNTQNRDGMALQTKLDELILTSDAENAFVGIERLTDSELRVLHAQCAEAAARHDRLASHAQRELKRRSTKTPSRATKRDRAV